MHSSLYSTNIIHDFFCAPNQIAHRMSMENMYEGFIHMQDPGKVN